MKGPEREAGRWFLQAEDDLLQIYTVDDLAEAHKDAKKFWKFPGNFCREKGLSSNT